MRVLTLSNDMEEQHAHRTASRLAQRTLTPSECSDLRWLAWMYVQSDVIACQHSTTYLSRSTAYVLLSRITAPLVKGRLHIFAFEPLCILLLSNKTAACVLDTLDDVANAGQTKT